MDARSARVLSVLDTGPVTNHVNLVSTANGNFAYVSVGGLNQVRVYSRGGGSPSLVATIAMGHEPHGIFEKSAHIDMVMEVL